MSVESKIVVESTALSWIGWYIMLIMGSNQRADNGTRGLKLSVITRTGLFHCYNLSRDTLTHPGAENTHTHRDHWISTHYNSCKQTIELGARRLLTISIVMREVIIRSRRNESYILSFSFSSSPTLL